MEALRSEAVAQPSAASNRDADANIPAALPNDDGKAQPLAPADAIEEPLTSPMGRWTPTSRSPPEHAEPSDHSGRRSDRTNGRTNWSPTRASEDSLQPTATISQPNPRGPYASAEQAAYRQLTSGPNAPAAIYARTLAGDSKQSATRADLTISAPQAPAVLAVRTVSEEGWNHNSQFRNPLRGARAVTRVAFDDSDASSKDRAADVIGKPENPVAVAQRSEEGWNPNSQFRNPLRATPAVAKVAIANSNASSGESAADVLSQAEKPVKSAQLEAPENPLRAGN
jgi:hypothetical protein